MKYWKRINPDGTTRTVESYSHDLDVEGAVEITQAEFDAYIAQLRAAEEEAQILAEEKQLKIAAAKDRFLAAIAAQTSPPWTDIFKDLAVALGLKEP